MEDGGTLARALLLPRYRQPKVPRAQGLQQKSVSLIAVDQSPPRLVPDLPPLLLVRSNLPLGNWTGQGRSGASVRTCRSGTTDSHQPSPGYCRYLTGGGLVGTLGAHAPSSKVQGCVANVHIIGNAGAAPHQRACRGHLIFSTRSTGTPAKGSLNILLAGTSLANFNRDASLPSKWRANHSKILWRRLAPETWGTDLRNTG